MRQLGADVPSEQLGEVCKVFTQLMCSDVLPLRQFSAQVGSSACSLASQPCWCQALSFVLASALRAAKPNASKPAEGVPRFTDMSEAELMAVLNGAELMDRPYRTGSTCEPAESELLAAIRGVLSAAYQVGTCAASGS